MNKYALIGYPLGHTFSPTIHNTAFKYYGMDAEYDIMEIEKSVFKNKIYTIKNEAWSGFNVTIPYKQRIISILDELDPIAEKIGAVNTIQILLNGTWKGYNTDYIGFTKPIQPWLNKIDTCLFIGAGGAAQAVGFSMLEFTSVNKLVVIDPIKKNAETLMNKLKLHAEKEYEIIDFNFSNNISGKFDLIINMSPVGMGSLKNQSPLSVKNISHEKTIVYDLIYNPARTLFLKEAETLGLKAINGLSMLIGQAEESFKIWTGKTFTDAIYSQIKSKLVE